MPAVTDRTTFKAYVLRRLGSPVIQINVHDDQVEDRVDEALEYLYEYGQHGIEKLFIPHTVTAQNITDRKITLPDGIQSVLGVVEAPVSSSGADSLFNVKYQFFLSDFVNQKTTFDPTSFYLLNQQIATFEYMFSGGNPVEFNKHSNDTKLYMDWDKFVADETVVVFEVWATIDHTAVAALYNDMWLKRYATALVKEQWGQNLSKLRGVQLPGGVELNGGEILNDAKTEIQELRLELDEKLSEPPDFFVG